MTEPSQHSIGAPDNADSAAAPQADPLPRDLEQVPVIHASALTRDGHLLIARMPAGCRVVCDWLEGASAEETTDVTDWFCDLVLIGWADAKITVTGQGPADSELVEVARLRLQDTSRETTGDVRVPLSAVQLTYVHAPTRDAVDVSPELALQFAARGIRLQVVAAVAQAVDVPDDPAAITA